MKKVAIWGMGIIGNQILNLIQKEKDIEVILVVDKDPEKIGQPCLEGTVQETSLIYTYAKEKKIDSIIFAMPNYALKEVAESLKDYSFLTAFAVPKYVVEFPNKFQSLSETLVEIDLSRPRLQQFESCLVEHCNINCKGCLKFCNMRTEEVFADFDSTIKDWTRMAELFGSIEQIKMLGGEPLLNPDICAYVKEARRLFPSSDIYIATNGLLVQENLIELFEVMKENNCYFEISVYPILFNKIEKIEALLQKHGVWYVTRRVEQFFRVISKDKLYDPKISYENCCSKDCTFLGPNGYIAVCGRPYYAKELNEIFGPLLLEPKDGFWNIHDENIDPWELSTNLKKHFSGCAQCVPSDQYQLFDCEQRLGKDAQVSDWFI